MARLSDEGVDGRGEVLQATISQHSGAKVLKRRLAAGLRSNLCTVERIRVRRLQQKNENLQPVLNFLNDPAAPVDDPAALLQAFARSTAGARPWLVDNQFQALQNSGNVRFVCKLQLSGYVDGEVAPAFADDDELACVIEGVRAARRDRSPTTVAEDLVDCVKPRPAKQ